jgi:cytochrome P450
LNFHAPAPKLQSRPLNAAEFVWTIARNPLAIWTEHAYSEKVLKTDFLGNTTVIVNDPAGIRHVLVENAQNYVMQPLRQRVLRPILRDGLLTAEGELWKKTRRSLAPVFAPRNILGLVPAMEQRSRLFAEKLETSGGKIVDIANEMTLLTFDILQATLFTGDIASEPQEFASSINALLRTMGRVDPLDVLDAPAFIPRLTRVLGERQQRFFRRVIQDTIGRREALIKATPDKAPRDLLTLLLETKSLSRSEIEDNIITFIGAGHETTARALGWTLYLLSQAPEERAKVEAELDAHDFSADPTTWGDTLVRTRAAFEEAMRLYPPAPTLNRSALADDEVSGVTIPKGASLLVLPWLVHRHKALWDAPGEFRPDRFMPENRGRIDRYQYLPFGVGPRVCIGQSFAMHEGIIAMALLLRRLRFDYTGLTPPMPVQKITVQPHRDLPMRVTIRA